MNKINYIKNRGITLISLVITIVILLILAGISISLAVGDNGLINKAKYAKEKSENARIQEDNSIAECKNQMDLLVPLAKPVITYDALNYTANIEYAVENNLTNTYSLDNGNTWNAYTGVINLKDVEYDKIIAKSKRANGEEITAEEACPYTENIYNYGDMCSSITGGWENWWKQPNRALDFNDDNISTYDTSDSYNYGYFGTNNAIDLTNCKTIIIKGTVTNGTEYSAYVTSTKLNYDVGWGCSQFNSNTDKSGTKIDDNTIKIDVSSLSGNYYVGFASGLSTDLKIDRIYLIK